MVSASSGIVQACGGCAEITCNLLRAAGCLASRFHARARGATIRADLVDVAARLARRGRSQLALHLPQYWHRESEWPALFEAACAPPPPGRPDQPRPGHRPRTGPAPPGTTPPLTPSREPRQAAEQASGRTPTPGFIPENSSGKNRTGKRSTGIGRWIEA